MAVSSALTSEHVQVSVMAYRLTVPVVIPYLMIAAAPIWPSCVFAAAHYR
jgi:hypothetical protein